MTVRRFTRDHPCPICGGYDNAPRGQGERCFGFVSPDGKWAHCTREEHAGGLPLNPNSNTYAHRLVGNCKCGKRHDSQPEPVHETAPRQAVRPRIVATYDYRDEQGKPLFQVVRYEPKSFNQRRPDGAGNWIWGLTKGEYVQGKNGDWYRPRRDRPSTGPVRSFPDCRLVLYRLPALVAADPNEPVWLPEGEKDADNLAELGFVTTTNAMGAKKWQPEYTEALRGRHVIIPQDDDEDGRKHAEIKARALYGVAASVKVLPPFRIDGVKGADVSDWLDAGGTRAELERFAAETPEWAPSPDEGDTDGRPWINAGQEDLQIITAEAWTTLQQANDPPLLFQHAGVPVRLEYNGHGAPLLRELNVDRLRYELARAARWYIEQSVKGDDEPRRKVVHPPLVVVHDVLATPNPPLPELVRIVEVPVFAVDGELQTERGYHAASQTYYAPADGFDLEDVPESPTADDVARARSLVLDELLPDFPFVEESDRAHAIALFLLPFARDLIDGPTPLHLCEAPGPGSGKGLLVDVVLRPALGRHVGIITDARDDDEWRKRITTVLREGHAAVLIDNLTRPLDSGTVAAALTAMVWTDRALGRNEMIRVPVRCAWIVTANNPVLSTEIARRCIRIRLDPKIDRPWLREGFKHENLRQWTQEHRAELVWAALVLVRAWMAAGRPEHRKPVLGSFERWSNIVGGILANAEIPGFLANLDDFYDAADLEGAVWRAFVSAWWDKFGDKEVVTSDLFPLAQGTEGFTFGGNTESAQKTSFGKKLARQRDRVIGEHRIVAAGKVQRASQWRLLPTKGDLTTPDQVKVKRESEGFHDTAPCMYARVRAHAHKDTSKTFTDLHNLHSDTDRVNLPLPETDADTEEF